MIVIVMEPVIVLFGFILAYTFSGPINMVRTLHKKRALRKLGPHFEEEVTVKG
jgi:hypothetical protein